jgi:hypothetical protein
MKKIVLIFCIINLFCFNSIAQENINSFDDKSLPILNDELRRMRNDIPKVRILMWYIPGDMETGTNKSAYLIVPFSGEIIKATAYIKTAPTGATTLKIDINKNGTTIWGNQDNRIQFVASSNTTSSSTFTTNAVTDNDYFTVDIDAIGSTLPGTNLTVMLYIKEAR